MSKVRFGDVVRDVKINVDRANNPYECYVAGEHMDTEDLRIHRWGSFSEPPEPGPAFIRIFKKGQVLYGSRRTYLKKVAVADFDGITANTTFVLETKDNDVFLQDLLPFLMYTESFTQFSIQNSKGSTNPYILFSDLARFEFELPPLEEQRKLAELLWVANETREAYKKLLTATDDMGNAQFEDMFGDPLSNPMGWETEPLGNIADVLTGNPFDSSKYTETGIKICGGLIIMPDRIAWESSKHWESADGIEKYLLEEGDIVLAMDRPWITSGFKIAQIQQADLPSLLIQRTARIRTEAANRDFLLWMLKSPKFRIHCNVTETTVPHISIVDIKGYKIFSLPVELKQKFSDIVQQKIKSINGLLRTLNELEATYKALLSENLG